MQHETSVGLAVQSHLIEHMLKLFKLAQPDNFCDALHDYLRHCICILRLPE